MTAVDTLLDLARNLFPPNLVQVNLKIVRVHQILQIKILISKATTQQYRTVLKYPGDAKYTESSGQVRDPENLYTWKIGGEYTDSMNILGLVFFSGKDVIEKTRDGCTRVGIFSRILL